MKTINNPIVPNWYADPEARYYNGKYYIYVTQSITDFHKQLNIDLLVSEDLVNWEVKTNIIEMNDFPWMRNAVWAPTVIEKDGKYYLIFATNNIYEDNEGGGLEIAVSDSPEGPFRGYLDKAMIGTIINGAQPIDAHLFKDDDGTVYLYYGGWGHCNIGIMNENMTGLVPFEDGSLVKEITPDDYVEAPCMIKKDGLYYFTWSTGDWMDESYGVNYGVSESPFGPFKKIDRILEADERIATGPGHNGYINIEGTDEYLMVYHRHPLGTVEAGNRLLCIDRMNIGGGRIEPILMTSQCVID